MIVLFTDFGVRDPYVGQVKARLAEHAPAQQVVDLLHEVPDFNPHAGAHLLAAFAPVFPPGSVFLAVVDPGVGTPRDAVVAMAAGRWFVGPDNGLLSVVAARHADTRLWRIIWQPEGLSATFHGRDLFAPIAADIARGEFPADKLSPMDKLNVEFDAGDLARVIYIDHYGNAWTGVRGVPQNARVTSAGKLFKHGESFGFVGKGEGFWFINSVGLLELAVNRGSAAATYGLKVGDAVQVQRLN
ncbi:MAG: SAM-dependent chlorinase/fluorinase [Candidatus Thermoplasmatota archaeon]|nr:SAM-dependent chlorinase/fluorinase [Candidatus Thermoplasmatota archaeon]MCL5061372.1 SAM-dependent chlorinase/fluorinase [Candidatus Thermoplasmatota archaeon]